MTFAFFVSFCKSHPHFTLDEVALVTVSRFPISRRCGTLKFVFPARTSSRHAAVPPPRDEGGFTLLELLVVIGIVAILMVLIAPAFTSIKSAGDVTSAAYTIKGVLDQARTYAVANNTYVWVGFEEVDVSKDASVSPQTTGIGRVAVAVIASKGGTRGYDVTNSSLSNPAWANYNNGASFVAIGKLQHFENLHLANSLPTTGNMARPSAGYVIGNAAASVTPFDWPLGSAIGAGQYSFQKVVNFDPQGVARLQYSTNSDAIVAYTEIGLQQTHGTAVSTSTNVVAIQLGGVGGSVTIYRP